MLRDARAFEALDRVHDPTSNSTAIHFQATRDDNRTSKCYLMMALNYTAALRTLLLVNKIDYDEKAIADLTNKIIKAAEKEGAKDSRVPIILGMEDYFFEYLERVLVPVLVQAGLAKDAEQAVDLLDKAKDWVAIEHPPMSMVTVDQFTTAFEKPRWVIRIDKPVCELTPAQKAELENYKRTYWYRRLSDQEKKLFEYYKPKLTEPGGRVIPSQLRSRLPLLKNSYQHQTFLVDDEDGVYASKCLLDVFHCGGVPYFDKQVRKNEREMQRLADQNMDQQIQNARKLSALQDDRIWQNHIVTLCSQYGDGVRGAYENYANLWKTKNGALPKPARYLLLFLELIIVRIPLLILKAAVNFVFFILPFGESIKAKLSAFIYPTVRLAKWALSPMTHAFTLFKNYFIGTVKPYIGFDSHIVTKTRAAVVGYGQCYSSNMCLNGFSSFESHDYKGIMEIYAQGERLLESLDPTQHENLIKLLTAKLAYLKNEIGGFHFALALIRAQHKWTIASKFAHYFLRLIEPAYRFIAAMFDTRITAIQIMSAVGQLAQQFNLVYEHLEDKQIPRINVGFGCASGENRTGLTEYHMQCEAVADACITIDKNTIRDRLAMSAHVQKVTAFQGGNAGMEGIRRKSMESLPGDYSETQKELFVTNYSDMKSVLLCLQKREKIRAKQAICLAKQKQPEILYKPILAVEDDYVRWFGESAPECVLGTADIDGEQKEIPEVDHQPEPYSAEQLGDLAYWLNSGLVDANTLQSLDTSEEALAQRSEQVASKKRMNQSVAIKSCGLFSRAPMGPNERLARALGCRPEVTCRT